MQDEDVGQVIPTLYLIQEYWPVGVSIWLLLLGRWKLVLAGMAAIFAAPFILSLSVAAGLFFAVRCHLMPSAEDAFEESTAFFVRRLVAAFSYLWVLASLWGYHVLKYTMESEPSTAAFLWGLFIVMHFFSLLESDSLKKLAAYKRFAEIFSAVTFVAAFVSAKVFGSFFAPVIGTYAVMWIFWTLISLALIVPQSTVIEIEDPQESDFTIVTDPVRDFENSYAVEPGIKEPDIEELDTGELDIEELDPEELDVEEHAADYFGVKMYWAQAVPRKRGRGQKTRRKGLFD